MADKMQNMNKLLKINGSAKMNRSSEKPATAHTLARYLQAKQDCNKN